MNQFSPLDSERRLGDVSRQRDGDAAPGENKLSISRWHVVSSESALATDDRAAIRAVLLHGDEQDAAVSSRDRFIFMPRIAM